MVPTKIPVGSCFSVHYELWSTREVWRARKKRKSCPCIKSDAKNDNNIAHAIAHAISVHYRDFEHAYVY